MYGMVSKYCGKLSITAIFQSVLRLLLNIEIDKENLQQV